MEIGKSTRLNSSHLGISYAVFCLKKKNALKQTAHTVSPTAVRDARPLLPVPSHAPSTSDVSPLSLHDALPISLNLPAFHFRGGFQLAQTRGTSDGALQGAPPKCVSSPQ